MISAGKSLNLSLTALKERDQETIQESRRRYRNASLA
jgi:hypothetical protein